MTEVILEQANPEVVIENPVTTLLLEQSVQISEISAENYEVVVSAIGERGPASNIPGPQGPTGPPGPAGGTGVFIQNSPAAQWIITHALGYRPNVSIVDSGGVVVEGRVQYVDATTILADFSTPFSGVAYLS